jgi:hypothetical protein
MAPAVCRRAATSTALALVAFNASVITAAKAEETVNIKRGYDRGCDWHHGWHRERGEAHIYIGPRDRDYDRDRFHRGYRDHD